jgi:hypothetical protein
MDAKDIVEAAELLVGAADSLTVVPEPPLTVVATVLSVTTPVPVVAPVCGPALLAVVTPDAPPLLVVPPVTGVGDPPQIAMYITAMHSLLDGS